MINKIKRSLNLLLIKLGLKYSLKDIDRIFLKYDKKEIRRTNTLQNIPSKKFRIGGKLSYAEWAHVIGLFQGIIYSNIKNKSANKILDIGSGTGLLAMSSEHYIKNGGRYTGLDVMDWNVEFCKQHYSNPDFEFVHFNVNNASYAKDQAKQNLPWPIESNSHDMVTALSVWTHLNEQDAIYYFKEVARVLKNGGRAIITMFYLDEDYIESLSIREPKKGRFHSTNQQDWIFSKPAYDSKNWFYTSVVKIPEDAIGLTKEGLDILLRASHLKLVDIHSGNWKEKPGLYFQDVLIFEKS